MRASFPLATLSLAAVALLTACGGAPSNTEQSTQAEQSHGGKVSYPETARGNTVDTYFGTEIADPYRWLEDDRSAETEAWVQAQNEVTFDFLEQIPFRDTIRERLAEAWNFERVGAPFVEGDYTYFYRNDGLQNQFVVYRQKDGGEPEVFLDPNSFSEDGTTSLATLSFSSDGSLAAYAISKGDR